MPGRRSLNLLSTGPADPSALPLDSCTARFHRTSPVPDTGKPCMKKSFCVR